MSKVSLTHPFEIVGDWFLPDGPSRRIAGELKYSADGLQLSLNDSISPLRGEISASSTRVRYQVVHGISRTGDAITLWNTQRSGVSINFGTGGLRQPETLIASSAILGAHLPGGFVFPEMSFRVPGLQVWLSRQNIEQEHHQVGERYLHTYRVLAPFKEVVQLLGIRSEMAWGSGWSSNADPFTRIDAQVSGWVTFRPALPASLSWYLEQLGKLNAMLAFLAGTPMSPDLISTRFEGNPDASVVIRFRDMKICEYENEHEFFITLGTMGETLQSCVSSWFEIYPKIQMPSQLALSVLATEGLWLHMEFLSLMQALEGLHRGLFEGLYIDKEVYASVSRSLIEAIPKTVTSAHRDSLKARIKYGNEISLAKRLNELADSLAPAVRAAIFGGEMAVPRQWIETRNYYTHWDQATRENVLDTQGMYWANVRLRAFLRALLVRQMGIPQTNLLKALQGTGRIGQHLSQLNSI